MKIKSIVDKAYHNYNLYNIMQCFFILGKWEKKGFCHIFEIKYYELTITASQNNKKLKQYIFARCHIYK